MSVTTEKPSASNNVKTQGDSQVSDNVLTGSQTYTKAMAAVVAANSTYRPLESAKIVKKVRIIETAKDGDKKGGTKKANNSAAAAQGAPAAVRRTGNQQWTRKDAIKSLRTSDVGKNARNVLGNKNLAKLKVSTKIKINGKFPTEVLKNARTRSIRAIGTAANMADMAAVNTVADAAGEDVLGKPVKAVGYTATAASSIVRKKIVNAITGEKERVARVKAEQRKYRTENELIKRDKELQKDLNKYEKTTRKYEKAKVAGKDTRRLEEKKLKEESKVVTDAARKKAAEKSMEKATKAAAAKGAAAGTGAAAGSAAAGSAAAGSAAAGSGAAAGSAAAGSASAILAIVAAVLILFVLSVVYYVEMSAPYDITDTEAIDFNDAEQYVMGRLLSSGFKAPQTAAVMANMWGESRFIPDAIESSGEGYGLLQWSYIRKSELIRYAEENEYDFYDNGVPDITAQMDWFLARDYNNAWNTVTRKRFEAIDDPMEACHFFMEYFVRPQNPSEPRPDREDKAFEYYINMSNEMEDKGVVIRIYPSTEPMSEGTWNYIESIRGEYLGKPYKLGSSGPNYYDCSGFVSSVLMRAGLLGHRMDCGGLIKQTDNFTEYSYARPGDLVYWVHTGSYANWHAAGQRPFDVGHVGLYLGNGYVQHSTPSRGNAVTRLRVNNILCFGRITTRSTTHASIDDLTERGTTDIAVCILPDDIYANIDTKGRFIRI